MLGRAATAMGKKEEESVQKKQSRASAGKGGSVELNKRKESR